jgi:hypothetical protein
MYHKSETFSRGEGQKPERLTDPQRSHDKALTLRDVALACLGRLLFIEEDVAPVGAEQTYLFNLYQPLRHTTDMVAALHCCLAAPGAGVDTMLARLTRLLGLSEVEVVALVFALLVEEEPMIGRLLAHLQAPIGGSRPVLGMLEAALAPLYPDQGRWLMGDLLAGPALASGVLQLGNEQAPLPEQSLKVPLGLALLLRGQSFVWAGGSIVTPEERVHLPQSTLELAKRLAGALGRSDICVRVVRSGSRREARSVASAVASQLGLEVLLIAPATDLKGLGAACLLGGRLPVFEFDADAADSLQLPELSSYSGPRLILAGPDTQVKVERGSILQWSLEPPSRDERQQLWHEYLDDEPLARQLAREHIHSVGRIAELAQLAKRGAQLQQRDYPELTDIRSAAWEAEAGLLGSLAQPITVAIPDEALVLSKTANLELQQLVARCRSREDLDAGLGITIKAIYQQGVRCLLVGPSGTGKTLVAGWLATRLGLPLYRVDLASVVSKYIGETEKNLATLLSRAEHSEIVLLFDEADSLFGKRTDIKDSNDRFANSQTNYLLQRIEFYRGIVLLTSNSRDRFDSAFTRRLDKVIEFPLPSPQERRALWQSHLGDGHQLSIKQINQLAVGSDLAGGHIRNAVLTAAVETHDTGRLIDFNDLVVGLAGEYRKLGRQFPAELRRYEIDNR